MSRAWRSPVHVSRPLSHPVTSEASGQCRPRGTAPALQHPAEEPHRGKEHIQQRHRPPTSRAAPGPGATFPLYVRHQHRKAEPRATRPGGKGYWSRSSDRLDDDAGQPVAGGLPQLAVPAPDPICALQVKQGHLGLRQGSWQLISRAGAAAVAKQIGVSPGPSAQAASSKPDRLRVLRRLPVHHGPIPAGHRCADGPRRPPPTPAELHPPKGRRPARRRHRRAHRRPHNRHRGSCARGRWRRLHSHRW